MRKTLFAGALVNPAPNTSASKGLESMTVGRGEAVQNAQRYGKRSMLSWMALSDVEIHRGFTTEYIRFSQAPQDQTL